MKNLIKKLLKEGINEISLNQSQVTFDIDREANGNIIMFTDDGNGK